MPKMIFLNLPISDLTAATGFYQAIGRRISVTPDRPPQGDPAIQVAIPAWTGRA